MNRREMLTGLLGLAGAAMAPKPALAHEPSNRLVDMDIEDPDADILALQKEYGAMLNSTITSATRVLRNRETGESVRFLRLNDGSEKWLYRAEPGAYVPFPHRHEQAEIYDVVKGKIDVSIDGEWITGSAGERVVIPSMAMHEAMNPYDEATEVLVDFDPMDEDVKKMGKAYWLACELGWIKPDGKPKMWKLLPEMRQIGSRSYPKGIPRFLVDMVLSF